ncbi:hypothetical protein [Mycoplasma capricolum]|uniref:hypothetical protein n=1 Tax=Mycoplasma capricolum TaxID=2095 RepID=UPI0002E3AA18|nr:hypothetical protein [Mycoplasma capricolum]
MIIESKKAVKINGKIILKLENIWKSIFLNHIKLIANPIIKNEIIKNEKLIAKSEVI